MPNITVELLEGRTPAQYAEFARVVTDAVTGILGAPAHRVRIQFTELRPDQIALTGTLMSETPV